MANKLKRVLRQFFSLNLIIIIFCLFSYCASKPIHDNYVFDNSGILDSTQKIQLNVLYASHEKLTTNQIVLMTTDSFYPDSTIEDFALRNLREMHIGQKGNDNGLLIVMSASLRKVRIETGYGTEEVLTSNIAKQIIDSIMVPRFKEQKYFEGIWNGSKAITDFLEKPENKIRRS